MLILYTCFTDTLLIGFVNKHTNVHLLLIFVVFQTPLSLAYFLCFFPSSASFQQQHMYFEECWKRQRGVFFFNSFGFSGGYLVAVKPNCLKMFKR